MVPLSRVLVIDDQEEIRDIVAMALELTREWRVDTAHSGAAAIVAVREARPDVILLDFMMPGLDGPATLRRLRSSAATRDIPVLFLTARASAIDRRRFTELGARGVIAKPFNPLTLAQQIEAILNVN